MDSFGILFFFFFNQKDNFTAVNVHRFGRLSGFQCETDRFKRLLVFDIRYPNSFIHQASCNDKQLTLKAKT